MIECGYNRTHCAFWLSALKNWRKGRQKESVADSGIAYMVC